MWINAEVDLPERLIAAHGAGELVVFAGAGVSMGPPSNLPSFSDMTDQVAGGAAERQEQEPLDHFLGRLAALGIDVERRTRAIVGDPASAPTSFMRI